MKSKIILGSANFEQKYGINKNFIKKSEIKKLFNLASKNKIKIVDTSPLYNNSEKLIGSINNNRFKIISKIPKEPQNIRKKNIKKWLEKSVMNSLKNLKIEKFECLLLHNSDSLLSKNGSEIYKSIKFMKTNAFTNKIGISIYDFNRLEIILKKFKFDLIQAPLSIFDQRLIKSGWLKKLKKKKIEVHARSIFLQGILLKKYQKLPPIMKKLNKYWIIWESWLKKNKLSPLQACLSYVLNQRQLDGVVVGYDNKDQLNQILKLNKKKNKFPAPDIKIKNIKLIDPRRWIN